MQPYTLNKTYSLSQILKLLISIFLKSRRQRQKAACFNRKPIDFYFSRYRFKSSLRHPLCVTFQNQDDDVRLQVVRELILRYVDKESGALRRKGPRALEQEKRTKFFSTLFCLSHIRQKLFFLSPEIMITQQNNSCFSRVYFPLSSVLIT